MPKPANILKRTVAVHAAIVDEQREGVPAMSFQAPISISDALSRVDDRRLLLPAIQREFVWGSEKIEWLFDSLLQGYPIGSFLFWQVRDTDKTDYPYYEILRSYRERYLTYVKDAFNTAGHLDFDAVLDGQQRLTSLSSD